MSLQDVKLVDLPKVPDARGNLTFIESERHVPFNIERVFYIYDVPGGAERGGHALKDCTQFLIAMSGSFDVILKYGDGSLRIHLNRSYMGLLIPPGIWREMDNFSSGSVCMALASKKYSEDSYIRNYEDFILHSGRK